MSIVFILTRHVTSEKTNELWQECIRAIRRFYPTDPILIIDDHSNPEFLSTIADYPSENILNISSEFEPGCGEMLAYYYFYKMKIADTAIILHDSFFLQAPIPGLDQIRQNSYFTTKFLLSFSRFHENFDKEIEWIQKLKNPESLVWWYHQRGLCRYGCQGIQSIISHRFLTEMQEKHHVLDLVPQIANRVDRMCMERVWAAVTMYYSPNLLDPDQVAVYGDFFVDYLDKYEHTEYEYFLANREKIAQEKRPFIKIFSGR
jgi:hypothetical protein